MVFKKVCVLVFWTKAASALKGLSMHGSDGEAFLTLPMLRLLSSKPCHVNGIHWIALTEYLQMGTHKPGFQSFFSFLHFFYMGPISHQQHIKAFNLSNAEDIFIQSAEGCKDC